MASYADAYGYTPEQFLSLTLPNLTHFGDYAHRQAEEMKNPKKGNAGREIKRQGQWKSDTSVESLIAQFGTKEAKTMVLNEAMGKPQDPPKQ
jgi:hypothetical protein